MKLLIYLIFIVFVSVSCKNSDKQSSREELTREDLKEPLINVNRQIANREAQLIDNYIERRKWDMTETGTGLRYMIYEQKEGPTAKAGQVAEVTYKISLLDGTVCYESEGDDTKSFLIGRDNVESGIHEGITYMKSGEKAIFIIPSHLAHGVTGDLNKIPPQSTLIVDLQLISLKK